MRISGTMNGWHSECVCILEPVITMRSHASENANFPGTCHICIKAGAADPFQRSVWLILGNSGGIPVITLGIHISSIRDSSLNTAT